MEWRTTRSEQAQRRSGRQEIDDQRRCVENVLAVVEHQQDRMLLVARRAHSVR
jgi:hypothetical protein